MIIVFPEALQEDQTMSFVLATIAAASRHRDPSTSPSSPPSVNRPSTSSNVPWPLQVATVNASKAQVPASALAVPYHAQSPTFDIGQYARDRPSTSRSGNHPSAHMGASNTGEAPAPALCSSDHAADDIDNLVNLFRDLATDPPCPPLNVPEAPTVQDLDPVKLYMVSSGRETGTFDNWACAGHATQGVPGGHVEKVLDTTPRNPNPTWGGGYQVYVVFCGLAPGIYTDWNIVKPPVNSIPGNIHKGFSHRYEAERVYVLAFAMGGLQTLPRRGDVGHGPPPATPTPQQVMDAFAAVPDDFLGADWYVVYKGKQPGLYPSWNFAASQTLNVSCVIHDKFPSKRLVERAWAVALASPGRVQVLN